MNKIPLALALVAGSLLALGTGCNKPETATAPDTTAVDARKATDAQKAAADKVAAEKVASDTLAAEKVAADKLAADKAAAEKVAADKLAADSLAAEKVAADKLAADKLAAEQAAAEKRAQTAAGPSKVQALIDSAKALAGDKKWGEVMKIISDLAGQQLTPAQQSTVDSLKAEATKQSEAALEKKAASDAGNAVGGLLQPKK